MTNADRFKAIFGLYATELWAKPEKEFLKWLNADVPDTNVGDMISRQAAIEAMRKAKDKSELHRMLVQLPSAQLAQDLTKGCTDTISRAAVVDVIEGVDWYHQNQHGEMVHGANDDEHQAWYKADDIYKAIESVPTAQPERTCVNCGRTVNNGGWYADGRTRCPIEEHYALPKDGYCHLWEKRNVTDDDYPERRTDG